METFHQTMVLLFLTTQLEMTFVFASFVALTQFQATLDNSLVWMVLLSQAAASLPLPIKLAKFL